MVVALKFLPLKSDFVDWNSTLLTRVVNFVDNLAPLELL